MFYLRFFSLRRSSFSNFFSLLSISIEGLTIIGADLKPPGLSINDISYLLAVPLRSNETVVNLGLVAPLIVTLTFMYLPETLLSNL